MELQRMRLSRSRIHEEQQFVRRHVAALLVLIFCSAVTATSASKPHFKKIFLIGDSYLDIGNRDPNNNTRTIIDNVMRPWKAPYGRTVGAPAGRYTDGDKCLGDLLGDALGLKPRPYQVLGDNSQPTNVADGVNFAVGGAGVFDNLGFAKTGDQILQLQAVLNSGVGGPYNSTVLAETVAFYALSGNDYATFSRNNANLPLATLAANAVAFVGAVVAQATQDLLALYKLGIRSFVVGKLAPFGCVPTSTYNTTAGNFTACSELFNVLATAHNANLTLSVGLSLPADASVIFLNNQLAFSTVTYNLNNPLRLTPCCNGLQNGRLCGDVDSQNNPQYTVCDPSQLGKYFFWDEGHPTEAGWKSIFSLFLDDSFLFGFPGGFPLYRYTDGKSLKQFLGV